MFGETRRIHLRPCRLAVPVVNRRTTGRSTGIAWDSAQASLPCLALLERAVDGLASPPSGTCSFSLTQPDVRDQLLTLVRDFGFTHG